MRYEEFQQVILGEVKKKVKGAVNVNVVSMPKCNNQERTGIQFFREDRDNGFIIYLEPGYDKYLEGADIDGLASELIEVYQSIPDIDADRYPLEDKEYIKQRVVVRLINTQMNEELLKSRPHIETGDLSIVYYCSIESDMDGDASLTIENRHLKTWGIDAEELHQLAMENTRRLFPADFFSMRQAIEEMLESEKHIHGEPDGCEEKDVMYVLTNSIRHWGAVAMLYPDVMEKVADRLGESYYIIPSSVHETIIVPESQAVDEAVLNEMIQEVNETVVDPEDILSDHFYFYSKPEKRINF